MTSFRLPPPLLPEINGQVAAGQPCPCCGQTLKLGLFGRIAKVSMPIAIRMMRQNGISLESTPDDSPVIIAAERAFLQVLTTLPLMSATSPVMCRIWVEVHPRYLASIDVLDGTEVLPSVVFPGTLACDLPGFPGSIGARCQILFDGYQLLLKEVSDARMGMLPQEFTHQDYVKLYQRMWGQIGNVEDADLQRRETIQRIWKEISGSRDTFYQPIEPHPRIAGIDPGLLAMVPPQDTGQVAMMSTVGQSDVVGTGNRRSEVVCWAENPSPEFSMSFAEFCYWTRNTGQSLGADEVIREPLGIPGTQDDDTQTNKTAWLVCQPWWQPELPVVYYQQQEIDLLAVLPLTATELEFGEQRGIEDLLAKLQDAPIFDLHRPSAV